MLCWTPAKSAFLQHSFLTESARTYLHGNTSKPKRLNCTDLRSNGAIYVKGIAGYNSEFPKYVAAASNSSSLVESDNFGEPISLGTMKLPANVDLKRMESLLFQV
eukprot:TRINITY_DN1455_c0_g1_i3.p1 TRINITY_DN1455_c0_g1~~TRINITY_DN1455_c0_g1_i3.p1  ORF type:complete len:105 (+),score=8.10 TRINITY_DN1455_c0_g1_i3:141-455(+)